MKRIQNRFGMLMVAAATAIGLSVPMAADAADFSGKKITLLVPYGEGGGADTIARLMQPYLSDALPGKPQVVILNQPGGGGVKGGNKFDATAPKDGTMLIVGSTSGHISFLLGNKAVKYDQTKWRGVMGLPRGAIVYVNGDKLKISGKDPKADIEMMRNSKVINGSKTPLAAELLDTISMELLGINNASVFGLSTSQQQQAFLRGEINLNNDGSGAYTQRVANATEGARPTALFAYGYMKGDGTIVRDPDHPNIPTFNEVYEAINGKQPSGVGYQAYLNLYATKVALSKVIALPAGTPQEIVDAHVAAFKKVYDNPKVREGLATEFGSMPVNFGKDVEMSLAEGMHIKDETKDWLNQLLKSKYNASL